MIHLARAAEAQRIITDCDQRLTRYRAALEAGTDPALIAQWTAEVNAARTTAQAQLRAATGSNTRMTAEEIESVITALGNIIKVLRDADPADKAKIYTGVGLRLTYEPGQNRVIAEAKPAAIMYEGSCPRGDTDQNPTADHQRDSSAGTTLINESRHPLRLAATPCGPLYPTHGSPDGALAAHVRAVSREP